MNKECASNTTYKMSLACVASHFCLTRMNGSCTTKKTNVQVEQEVEYVRQCYKKSTKKQNDTAYVKTIKHSYCQTHSNTK